MTDSSSISSLDEPISIVIGTDESGVEIQLVDADVKARVSHKGFTGVVTAWISASELSGFLIQLVEVDSKRSGSATLTSMSPGELSLSFRSLDRLGHMGVEGEMTRYFYGPGAG